MHHTIASAERCIARPAHVRSGAAPLAAVIVPSAMGVTQSFYARFAEWLAARGYLVVTFDYRGIGLSAPATLRGFEVDIRDWATQDCAAVIDFVKARRAERAAVLGRAQSRRSAARADSEPRAHRPRRSRSRPATATGARTAGRRNASSGGCGSWSCRLRLRIAGYFPGKRLRKVGDLPRGVMEQWRRWCLEPRVRRRRRRRERARAVRVGAHADAVAIVHGRRDDVGAGHSLAARLYTNAPIEYRRIAPRDVGAQRIGHFGFFRPQFEQTLWPLVPQWLRPRELTTKKITCAMSPPRTSASEMAQGDGQPPSSASLNRIRLADLQCTCCASAWPRNTGVFAASTRCRTALAMCSATRARTIRIKWQIRNSLPARSAAASPSRAARRRAS